MMALQGGGDIANVGSEFLIPTYLKHLAMLCSDYYNNSQRNTVIRVVSYLSSNNLIFLNNNLSFRCYYLSLLRL